MTSPDAEPVMLTLYVSGASELAARAITHVRALCDSRLGVYELAVRDLQDDSVLATSSGVMAAPALVRSRPLPARTYVGDMSRTREVLDALELADHGPEGAHGEAAHAPTEP